VVGFVELAVVAFTAQLAVLPGEKGQFIVATLSTRYPPLVVVAAAASAFAGWTALELLAGRALQGALPPWLLDALTAGLFLLFAVMLYRSAPSPGEDSKPTGHATDGGVGDPAGAGVAEGDLQLELLGRELELPQRFGGFVPIFALLAAGEFGDKTQLVTIGLAIQYGARPAIWVGEMAAIVPVSLANAYFFHRFAGRFDVRKAHLVGAGMFLFFGLDTLLDLVVGLSLWETAVETVASVVTAVLVAPV
jgi:putative Ca2+/H+ antiporter (TMEM165/GDT1 family)